MAAERRRTRVLTVRYVGALVAVATLLVTGQIVVQVALDAQKDDARIVNLAGRQRMLSQRLCMLLLALDGEGREHAAATLGDVARVADEWQSSQLQLRQHDNSRAVDELFGRIDVDHAAMLRAARAAVASGPQASHTDAANEARAHADPFLAGMNQIVAQYEHEAHGRVVTLRRTELGLLILALLVLAAEGVFVFRPAVRGLRAYLVDRDEALRRLLDVSDREQQRIAQDLHDGLSQHLVGISYLVKSLEQEVGDTPARARVAEIGQLIGESIESTRRLARSLHSSTLDADGLEPALLELALYTERLFGVPCHVDVAASIDVPVEIRRHLYRIAREGVLNAAKHAKASTIEVAVARTGRGVSLVVHDDGIGIAPGRPQGMGLRLMESRAKLLGAPLSITSRSPRGTTVSCTVTDPGGLA